MVSYSTTLLSEGIMKCFSLFSGIGGFDLAMRNLGHVTVGACEIDKYARSVYARHFPGVKIYQDATKIKPKELPEFDILCADLMIQEVHSFLKLRGLLKKKSHAIFFWKMSKVFYLTTKGRHSLPSSEPLMKWGMMQNGRLLTANISFHKIGNASSLSDILEGVVPDKYFLSEKMTRKLVGRET